MNILYFDERELWSPKLDEILEELEDTEICLEDTLTRNNKFLFLQDENKGLHEELEDTEIKTINTKQMQSGKKFTISVASYFQPDQKFQISVAEE